jgi:hypothetical protein
MANKATVPGSSSCHIPAKQGRSGKLPKVSKGNDLRQGK